MLKYNPGRERRNAIKVITPVIFVLMAFSGLFLLGGCFSRVGIKSVAIKSTGSTQNLPAAEAQQHKTTELACQEPPHYKKTGQIIGSPTPFYKDYFGKREEVWVALDTKIIGRNHIGKTAKIYIVHKKTAAQWDNNPHLIDITGKKRGNIYEEDFEEITFNLDDPNIIFIQAWKKPVIREEGYDVVVDFYPFGEYNRGQDILDGREKKGFFVPPLWVCLKSITFNHFPIFSAIDAIKIKMNLKEKVRIPEWKKGKKSYPAAYIRNRQVIYINPVFYASPRVKTARIKAVGKDGDFKDLGEEKVNFKNGISRPVYFRISGKTPNTEIKAFNQEWEWYCSDINGTGSSEVKIGSSKNRIYVLLKKPKPPPWRQQGGNIPWADVLEYSCKWAEGEKNQPGAVEKITHALYEKTGGYYDKYPRYTKGNCKTPFRLKQFLNGMLSPYGVGKVNCYDMAKALVTFANMLGCNVSYKVTDINGDYFNCIKPVGLSHYCLEPGEPLAGQCLKPVILSYYCCEYFSNHAYGMLKGKVFDPTFKLYKENQEKWLTDLPVEDYFNALLYEGGTPSLKMKRIPGLKKDVIIDSIAEQMIRIFYRFFLKKVLEFFDFVDDKPVIPGIKIDCGTVEDIIFNICKYKYCESFRFIDTCKTKASVIHKVWYTEGKLLDITITVYPNFKTLLKDFIKNLFYSLSDSGLYKATEISRASAGAKNGEGYWEDTRWIENISLCIKVGGDLKEKEIFCRIVKKLQKYLDNQSLVDQSELKEKFNITLWTKPSWNKKGNRVPLCLEVIKNEAGGEVHCFWRTPKGYIGKNDENDFFYCGEEVGMHCIKVIVVNKVGLMATAELNIEIEAH